MAVPALLREHGADPVKLLAEFGLEPADFEDPENRIGYSTVTQLLGRCTEVTRCTHFGLLVGQRAGTSALGAVGFLMQSSPTVRTALEILVRHLWVRSPSVTATLVEDNAFATLALTFQGTSLEGLVPYLDMGGAIICNIMRGLCGHQWQASEVRFAHRRPRNLAPFQRFFRAPLRFDTGETAVVFARGWMDRPLLSADPLLHTMMQQRVREQASLAHDDVSSQLRRILPSLVTTQGDSLAVASKRLGLAARTLNRRLAAEGTSYLQLREEARYTIARQLLASTHMPANEVADHLGYANASAFTRAFRKWSGKPPAEWRASKARRAARVSGSAFTAQPVRDRRREIDDALVGRLDVLDGRGHRIDLRRTTRFPDLRRDLDVTPQRLGRRRGLEIAVDDRHAVGAVIAGRVTGIGGLVGPAAARVATGTRGVPLLFGQAGGHDCIDLLRRDRGLDALASERLFLRHRPATRHRHGLSAVDLARKNIFERTALVDVRADADDQHPREGQVAGRSFLP